MYSKHSGPYWELKHDSSVLQAMAQSVHANNPGKGKLYRAQSSCLHRASVV